MVLGFKKDGKKNTRSRRVSSMNSVYTISRPLKKNAASMAAFSALSEP